MSKRVVLLGGFDYEYPREKSFKRGLERHGVSVSECRYADEQMFIGLRKLLLLPLFYVRIIRRFRALRQDDDPIDAVIVTKFNHSLLPVAWILSLVQGCPLFYDVFVSLRGTVEMRGAHSVVVWGLGFLERLTLKLPDRYLIGTRELARLNAERARIPEDDFVIVPPGADEDRFYPRPDVDLRDTFTVLYWGNHLPHHGLETILRAAAELQDVPDVEFVVLGEGPEEDRMRALAADLDLRNLRFEGRVPWDDLFEWIASSHVALGVFSAHDRTLASITNKVCEGVAMGKAVITEQSPAIEEWFTPGTDICTVPPEDPEALADAIRKLKRDPERRERLEVGARRRHEEEFTVERIGERLLAGLSGATGDSWQSHSPSHGNHDDD